MTTKTTIEILREMRSLADQLAESNDDTVENYSQMISLINFINKEVSMLSYFGVSHIVRENDSKKFFGLLNSLISMAEPKEYLDRATLFEAIEKHLTLSGICGPVSIIPGTLKICPGIGITFSTNCVGKYAPMNNWGICTKREASLYYPEEWHKRKPFDLSGLRLDKDLPLILPAIVDEIIERSKVLPVKNETNYLFHGKIYRCSKLKSIKEVNDLISDMVTSYGVEWGLLDHNKDDGCYYVAAVEDEGN